MLFLNFDNWVFGTHFRGAEITYESAGWNTYLFTVRTYTTSSSPADNPYIFVDWGDGQIDSLERIEIVPDILLWNGQQNIYKGTHFFNLNGTYDVKFSNLSRHQGILNIPGSVSEGICVTTSIVISTFFQNNSAWFSDFTSSILGCTTEPFNYIIPVNDLDGDSLTSELIPCTDENCLPISSYQFPNEMFTTNFSYNNYTHTIYWDLPYLQGEYSFAVKFNEWKDLGNGTFILAGTVVRDFLIIINSDCALVGIENEERNFEKLHFNILPNPNNGNFKLDLIKVPDFAFIKVYDISGKIVLEKNLIGYMNGNSIDFEIPNAESGLYLLEVQTEEGIESIKFIIE